MLAKLILLDLNLPDNHGSEVLKILQANPRTHDIPVVIINADSKPHQLENMTKSGARSYLSKQLDVKLFLKVIGQYF